MNHNSYSYSNLTNENKLLVLCSRTKLDNETKSKVIKLLPTQLDWDYILNFARLHKLMPLLYWNLKEFQFQIPEMVFIMLKENFYNNSQRNLQMIGELFNLLKLFEKDDLKVIPYKGPVLSLQAYNHIGLRQFDDLDIFVHQNDVIPVKKLLITNGFIPKFNLQGNKEMKFLKTQREYKFRNLTNNIPLEVQWKFNGSSFYLAENIGFEVSEVVEIYNKKILSLSSENLLLILCIHASGHYWKRLSWICDISELIKTSNIDWEYVFEKAEKLGVMRVLLINLSLVRNILDVDMPKTILNDLESKNIVNLVSKITKRIFTPKVNNIFIMADIRFSIREKKYHGIQDIIKIMFLPTNSEWEKSSLLSSIPFLSYFYRFFQVLKSY